MRRNFPPRPTLPCAAPSHNSAAHIRVDRATRAWPAEAPIFQHHGAFPCHRQRWRPPWSYPFERLRMTDVESVGGKNASLGEMISQLAASGVRVPGGFATTAHAFREFLRQGGLADRINDRLATLDTDDVRALAEAGAQIRAWIARPRSRRRSKTRFAHEFASLTADDAGCVVCRAFIGHRRGLAGREFRGPAGDLPQRGRHR